MSKKTPKRVVCPECKNPKGVLAVNLSRHLRTCVQNPRRSGVTLVKLDALGGNMNARVVLMTHVTSPKRLLLGQELAAAVGEFIEFWKGGRVTPRPKLTSGAQCRLDPLTTNELNQLNGLVGVLRGILGHSQLRVVAEKREVVDSIVRLGVLRKVGATRISQLLNLCR
jgi:hypothetical protein